MKIKRKWAVTPMFLLFSAVMLCFACFSYRYSLLLFYIELAMSLISIIAVIVSMIFVRKYISSVAKSALKAISGGEREFLENFPFPVAVTGEGGDILWINDSFAKNISSDRTPHGEYITNFLGNNSLEKVYTSSGMNITNGYSKYTVFASKSGDSAVFYFIDDTELKNAEQKYYKTRPCVVSVVFDNREEFERESDENSVNSVIAPLEALIIKWAAAYNGAYRKLSGGKYLIIFEESDFSEIEKSKFAVLDEVREIKSAQGTVVTVSIGVGKGGSNFKECDLWSKKALEMALGRGGDQAVIKNENDYRFFGGISQGVERRNKVRSRVFASAISDKIKLADKVYIMGHSYSDLDCIGAAAGLYAVVTKAFNKPAGIIVKEGQSPASVLIKTLENSVDSDMFIEPGEALKSVNDKTLLIIVDTHSSAFLESTEVFEKAKNVIVIDHHRMMVNHISNASVFYQETFASSACEMVTEIVQYIGDSAISKPIAEALMAGIMLDTKSFTVKTASRTFDASAYLCRKSADMVAVKHLFAGTLEDYKAKCELVFGAELYGKYAVASTPKLTKNIRITAAQAADELLNIKNVDASFVIFPTQNGVSISARSLGRVNVQLIMEALGGGGHHTMAAVQLKDIDIEQARQMLLEKLEENVAPHN